MVNINPLFQPFPIRLGHRRCPLAFALTAAINLVDWGNNSRIVAGILHQTILRHLKWTSQKKRRWTR